MYGATSYNVYVSLASGVTTTNSAKIANVGSPYVNTSLTDGTTYYYVVTAVSGGGESVKSAEVSATTVQRRLVPNTGQTLCSNASGTIINCSFTRQDGDISINLPSYRDNSDGTITDLVTGLLWQKQDDATQRDWGAAMAYCSSMNLGTHSSGWRLPTDIELIGLVDFGKFLSVNPSPPAIASAFGTAQTYGYWTSETYATDANSWWSVWFGGNNGQGLATRASGTADYMPPSYVRCVYGTPTIPSFTDNQNGTVTDNVTGLLWQQQDDGVLRTWDEALNYCNTTFGGNTAGIWRMPSIKELASLADKTKTWPGIDSTYFLNTKFYNSYASSTSNAGDYTTLWTMGGEDGAVGTGSPKTGTIGVNGFGYYVRCVR